MRRASAVAAMLLLGAIGCSARQSAEPEPAVPAVATPRPATPVAVPTVPPSTPIPAGAAPLPTRPIKNPKADAEKRAGKQIGPVITFAGVARADGHLTQPVGKTAEGYPIFRNPVGSGFMIVIEAKPGISNLEGGRSIMQYNPDDPTQQPDLQIEVNRPLGDGNPEVCDRRRPKIGGIPAVSPPSFKPTRQVSDALNDFACRFETFLESSSACTVNKLGDFSFAEPKESKIQFCMVVARAWNFAMGDTLVSVRVRDVEGNPGPVSHFVLRREPNPTPPPRPKPAATPTVSRRRE